MTSLLDRMIAETNTEIATLQAKLFGMMEARRVMSGKPPARERRARAPRASVKDAVLRLLEEHRHSGINAKMAVQMAEDRGIHLRRDTVSGLLSRLAKEGTLSYDGRVYRIQSPEEPI